MCAWFLLHCLVFKEHPRLLFCRNTALLPPHLPSTYVLCTSRSGSSLRLVLQQNSFAINFVSEAFASWVSLFIIPYSFLYVKNFFDIIFKLWKLSYFVVFTFCYPFLCIGWRLVLYYTFLFSLSTLYFYFYFLPIIMLKIAIISLT